MQFARGASLPAGHGRLHTPHSARTGVTGGRATARCRAPAGGGHPESLFAAVHNAVILSCPDEMPSWLAGARAIQRLPWRRSCFSIGIEYGGFSKHARRVKNAFPEFGLGSRSSRV